MPPPLSGLLLLPPPRLRCRRARCGRRPRAADAGGPHRVDRRQPLQHGTEQVRRKARVLRVRGRGLLHKFYQSCSSSHTVSVVVLGNKVPLYGDGPTLTAAGGKQAASSSSSVAPVPMVLQTTLHSRAYVLGALKFTLAVECRVVMNPTC
ncbi:unnamed protein product [Urochloa humidicola]